MHRLRIAWLVVLVGSLVGLYVVLRDFGLACVRPVPSGDQEIAWLNPANARPTWERIITGLQHLRTEHPDLRLDLRHAYPPQTAAVPEVALWLDGSPRKLWIRWYKLTSQTPATYWLDKLARRDPPPLAMLGGGSSDRALELANALAEHDDWGEYPAPLLLLTTATADQVAARGDAQVHLTTSLHESDTATRTDLMHLYPRRTFRFCFTNNQMVQAMTDFIWSRPELRPLGSTAAPLGAVPHLVHGDILGVWGWLAAGPEAVPPAYYAAVWLDDPYSIDLSNSFDKAIRTKTAGLAQVQFYQIMHSIGGYATPNSVEAMKAHELIQTMACLPLQRSLLILPAVDRPARRFLRTLYALNPDLVRQLVVVNGDAISFNTIYRDRDFAWNIMDLPVPLVFFCHRNPVQWSSAAVGPDEGLPASATDDVLLYADIFQNILEAAYQRPAGGGQLRLVANADELRRGLRSLSTPIFTDDGNRRSGTGEYVVWLQPCFDEGRNYPCAVLRIFRRQLSADDRRAEDSWEMVCPPMTIDYKFSGERMRHEPLME
ncbi:MAG: hypothetical protein ACK4RK_11175 [Gemmataceae bacterium]